MKNTSNSHLSCFTYLTATILISLFLITANSFAVPVGDLDRDGYVSFEDLSFLCLHWLESNEPNCPADIDGDCDVNLFDYAILAQNWLKLECSSFTATASSFYSLRYPPSMAIDNGFSTDWLSASADNQWLEIDMGQIRDINGLEIYWGSAYPDIYNIQVSNDNSTWTTVYNTSTGNGGTDYITFLLQSVQYIKINCVHRATTGGNSIYEVIVQTDDMCTGYLSGEYQLVWSDEFNGTTLNTANWECMIGDGSAYGIWRWGNMELEYYRAENATVSDGYLTITAKEESYGGYNYTSARIRSKNKKDFLFGRMEARIKVPYGYGMWPAFWMMPTYNVYGGWSYSGEVDIMETCNYTNYVGGTLIYGGAPTVYSSNKYYGNPNYSDDFHIYAIEWEPDVIRWYVDGYNYYSVNSATWYSNGAPTDPQAPFDQYFHFLLNVAVGGYYTGCTSPSCITATFPQQMYIDYLRVYQKIP